MTTYTCDNCGNLEGSLPFVHAMKDFDCMKLTIGEGPFRTEIVHHTTFKDLCRPCLCHQIKTQLDNFLK